MVILLLLTLITLSIGAQTSLPRVSYIKAIDVYMFVCLFFVFATLGVVVTGKTFGLFNFVMNTRKPLSQRPTVVLPINGNVQS